MTKTKKLFKTAIGAVMIAGFVGFAGCGGVSEEQLAQLEDLRNEVKTLEQEVNALKSEKTKLEREIAEHNVKLDQCEKDKAATLKNLEQMNKTEK